jgi:hypothetical protein
MTDNDQILTAEWLAQKIKADKQAEAEAEEERREERAREQLREAHIQQHGVEPTLGEIEEALREKRRVDTVETARANEVIAREGFRRSF